MEGLYLSFNILSLLKVEYIVPAILLAMIAVFIIRIIRKQHTGYLEEEIQNDQNQEKHQEIQVEVSYGNRNQETQEKLIFMPVPATVSEVIDFIETSQEDVVVRSIVRAEEVNRLMSNEVANSLTAVVYRPFQDLGEHATVFLDILSEKFKDYSYINLNILKQKGFVEREVSFLTIHSRGILKKPLMIEANEFSSEAVKMISLTGGRAILIRS